MSEITTSAAAIIAVIIVSLISLIGLFTLSFNQLLLKRITSFLVSLAAGTLIGDVFLHIIPELYAQQQSSNIGMLIILGITLFFVMESFLHWHHHHDQEHENDKKISGVNNIVADALHNFVDGVIIASGFLAGPEVGFATTIAVLLHEIPQEIGDFGVLIHAGFSRSKALLLNFSSALTAILGAIFALTIGRLAAELTFPMLAFTAGGFIYIAIADLLPELKCQTSWKRAALQLVFFITGVVIMQLLLGLE